MSDPFAPPDQQYPYDPYGVPLPPPPLAAGPATPSWLVPLVAGLVALGLVTGVGVVLARLGEEHGASAVLPSPGAPVAAECAAVARHQVPAEAVHEDGQVGYDASPPHSGVHNPRPLERSLRVVHRDDAPPLAAERAVHNLEHAYVVVWYDDRVTDEQLRTLDAMLAGVRRPKVLAVPWRERMAQPYVLAAWGATQACAQPTAEAVRAFYDAETGRAPEQGAL